MIFNKHLKIKEEGAHAFFGASKWHWINYDDEKVAEAYNKHLAVQKGIELHAYAALCIKLKQKLPKSNKTINRYVNDAIGYQMIPEQVLYYSDNCFGTADTIVFKNNLLRVHDLKTGNIPAHVEQLKIYAALFCLEYKINPMSINFELRIYQNDNVVTYIPTGEDILTITDKIITADKIIAKIKAEEE